MFASLRLVWRLLAGRRLMYAGALTCLFLATLFSYLVPLIGSVAIDHGLSSDPPAPGLLQGFFLQVLGGAEALRGGLWRAAVAMVSVTLVAGVATYAKGRLLSLAADGIARTLKEKLYDHLQRLPARFHDKSETGDLVQRCTSDVETTRQFLAVQLVEVGNAVAMLVLAVPLLLQLDAGMTLVSVSLVGPIIAFAYVYFRRVKHVFKSVDEAEGALTSVIQENLTGIRVVRAFARQEFEQAKFARRNSAYRDHQNRLIRLMSWYWAASDVICLAQSGLVLVVGAHRVSQGTLSLGELFGFIALLGIFLWPVRQLGRILTDLGKATVALGRIREVLDREEEKRPVTPGAVPSEPLRGAIRVTDLRFRHGEGPEGARHALDGVSFDVRPGQTLALLGPSGAGKSTFIHLLLRLYDYTEGSIRLDGRELSLLDRAWVRGQVAAVMQEPFLFSKTLRENIRLGSPHASDEAIEAAASAAAIHDTIRSFTGGYDTLIGERGITLSGGQRQRVALARALVRDPAILVLDDALSAVDGETESLVLEALRTRHGRRTTLVIAHRLATLMHADQIVVLDHGRVVQRGTHAELSAVPGLYRRLWTIQTSLESEFAATAAATSEPGARAGDPLPV